MQNWWHSRVRPSVQGHRALRAEGAQNPQSPACACLCTATAPCLSPSTCPMRPAGKLVPTPQVRRMTSTLGPAARLSRARLPLSGFPSHKECLRTQSLLLQPTPHIRISAKVFLFCQSPFLAWPTSTPQPCCPLHMTPSCPYPRRSPSSPGSLLAMARPSAAETLPLTFLWWLRLTEGTCLCTKKPT